MIPRLKPYPAYRETEVEWLMEVPEHWNLRRTKSLLVQRSEKGFPNEPLLAATQTKGVVRKGNYEHRTVLAMKDLELLKIVYVGDFVISLRSFQGGIEFARERGIISPAYTVLYPRESDHHAYLARVFKSRPYLENLSLFVTGIRQGQNIDYERLARSYLPLPPRTEQTTIVRFLDHIDQRIQRYIQAKQKLVRLLEEQKQAVIHHAITGKIDVLTGKPYPSYKRSGVKWVGDVPDHWKVRRLKTFVINVVEQTQERQGHEPYLALENVESWTGRYMSAGNEVTFESQVKRFQEGDVLFGKLRPYLAKVTRTREGGVCVGEFLVLRTNGSGLLPAYLESSLRSRSVIDTINGSTYGAKMPRADWQFIGALKQPIPPFSEQTNIVEYLDKVTNDIDTAIARTGRQIELLNVYRTRLVSDVVTGKLDVREAAAKLPNETESMDDIADYGSINDTVSQVSG